MIQLITKVEGEILGNYNDVVPFVTNVSAQIQREDYINVPGFIGLTQNLTRAEYTILFNVPFYFGLTNQSNKEIVTLEISY